MLTYCYNQRFLQKITYVDLFICYLCWVCRYVMQSWHGVKPSDSCVKITVGNWQSCWIEKRRRSFLTNILSSWLRKRKKSSG